MASNPAQIMEDDDWEDIPDYALKWERERLRALRALVDPICHRIRKRQVTESEARELMAKARLEAALLIPDQMETWDLIYESRFERLIEQYLRETE